MPRGGKRPGAGAPKGNISALKHGERSREWLKLTSPEIYNKHPGRGKCKRMPGAGASKGNLHALKTGLHSKRVIEFVETDPVIKSLRLSRDKAISYVVGQCLNK